MVPCLVVKLHEAAAKVVLVADLTLMFHDFMLMSCGRVDKCSTAGVAGILSCNEGLRVQILGCHG